MIQIHMKQFMQVQILSSAPLIFMKNVYLKYCILYFLIYVTFGTIIPYLNVYLESLGLSGSQIGTITFLTYLFGMLFAPIFGYISDASKDRKTVLAFLLFFSAITLIIFSKQTTLIAIAFTIIINAIFKSDIYYLADSLVINYCDNNNKDFYFIR